MYHYFYYGYLGYVLLHYSYLLDYGYTAFYYGNRIRHFLLDKPIPPPNEDWEQLEFEN
jgi:hypothetical protein